VSWEKVTAIRVRAAREAVCGVGAEIFPEGEDPGDWDLWVRHRNRGGALSFVDYIARAKVNREKRRSNGFIPRFRIPKDEGLRMEPKSVIAKFGRLGLLPKAPTRQA